MKDLEALKQFVETLMQLAFHDKFFRVEQKETKSGRYVILVFYTNDYSQREKDRLYRPIDVLDGLIENSECVRCFRRNAVMGREKMQCEEWSLEPTIQFYRKLKEIAESNIWKS